MENAAYVSPPPLPPQAHLTAAFQAANTSTTSASTTSFQEALMSRMGRPFGLTVRQFCSLRVKKTFFSSKCANILLLLSLYNKTFQIILKR